MEDFIKGKIYNRPCIWYMPSEEWIPLLEPPHADTSFCFDQEIEHYHPDHRFWPVNEDQINFEHVYPNVKGTIQRPFVCLRTMQEVGHHGFLLPSLAMLTQFADYNLKSPPNKSECWKCPHRGTDLSAERHTKGIVKCSAHGLPWNMETGEIGYKGPFFMRIKGSKSVVPASYHVKFLVTAENISHINGKRYIIELLDHQGNVIAEKDMKYDHSVTIGDSLNLIPSKNCPKESEI